MSSIAPLPQLRASGPFDQSPSLIGNFSRLKGIQSALLALLSFPMLAVSSRAQDLTAPEIAVFKTNTISLIDGDATVAFEPLKLGSPGTTTSGATQILTIRNTGNAVLSGLAITVDGDNASDFTVSALEADTIAPGAGRTFIITFKPSAVGTRSAALHIASNDADENPFDIKLTGTGLAPEVTAPEIAVFKANNTISLTDGDATVAFEPLKLGIPGTNTSGATQTLTIRNTGNAILSGLALTVDGDNAADFTVSALEADTIAPGAGRIFIITFKPGAVGTRSAALHIASNDADENPFDINLTGTGLAPEVTAPEIAVFKANTTISLIDGDAIVAFEPLKLGIPGTTASGATQILTIRNTGNAVLSGLALTVDGDNASDFTVSALEADTIAPSAGRTFTITFKPGAVGTRSAALHIASNDADENPFDIKLTGTGLAPEVTAPEIAVFKANNTISLIDGDATVAFEPLKLGSPGTSATGATQTLTIRNTGNAILSGLALTVDGDNAADFTVSTLEADTVAPGSSRTFTITFKPGTIGPRTAALHIANNDADENPFDIKLTGTGLAPEVTAPEIAVFKANNTISLIDGDATVAFEPLKLGSPGTSTNGATQILTIRNTGNAVLSGLALTVDGDNASEFTVSALEADTIAPGAGRTFAITFRPGAIGPRSAALHIASNDADENPFDIKLTGTGLAPEVTAPEIAVFRSSTISLIDGDATVAFEPLKLGSPGTSTSGATQILTIRNTGNAVLSGLALTVDGDNASDFTVSALEADTIAPGAGRTFTIIFKPGAIGPRSAALHIASNDADENPFDIKLTGTGLAPEVTAPEIAVFKANTTISLIDGDAIVAFEPLKLGSPGTSATGATQILTIRNTGNAVLSGLAITVDGDNASDFTVSALEADTIAPGTGRTFTITFRPGAIGPRSAALHIASNDADENPFDIRLTGTGLAPEVTAPEIAVFKTSSISLIDGDATIAFEPLKPATSGTSSTGTTQILAIRNTGNAVLSGLALTVDGDNASDFTVSALEADTIVPGTGRTFTINFRPGAIGPRSAALHIASNDADENPFDIKLTGTGVAPEVTAPEIAVFKANNTISLIDGNATVAFEPLKLGAAGATQTLAIRNTGNAVLSGLALTVDGDHASDFTVSALEVNTIAPGAGRTFTITFKAGAAGPRSAALHIASNDADENPFDIRLIGNGVATPEIEVRLAGRDPLKDEKAIINFGTVSSDSESETRTFTITNRGTTKLTGLTLRKNGIDKSDFSVSPLKDTSLNPGKSLSFKVTFNPTDPGTCWAAVHIGSNDPDTTSFDIALTGKCPTASSAKSSALQEAAAIGNPPTTDSVVSTVLIDGRKYRCITVQKTGGIAIRPADVEVSGDLVHWFSGARHTTVVRNNASVLKVRDNTPLTREVKRYIRLRKRA